MVRAGGGGAGFMGKDDGNVVTVVLGVGVFFSYLAVFGLGEGCEEKRMKGSKMIELAPFLCCALCESIETRWSGFAQGLA